MTSSTPQYRGLLHVGGGAGLALVQASAIIPGLLPTLILVGVFVIPVLVLGLVLGLLAVPPYGTYVLVRRRRARHRAEVHARADLDRRGQLAGDRRPRPGAPAR